MMSKQNRKVNRRLGAIALALPLALSGGFILPVEAENVKFLPPLDRVPDSSVGEGLRGKVRFAVPDAENATPQASTGGGVRGEVKFAVPDAENATPQASAGGGVRGEVKFAVPDAENAAPQASAGGGVRAPETFLPPGESALSNSLGEGVGGDGLLRVTPLIPTTKMGRAVTGHPTIFVYVPPIGSKQVFFSLQDENRKTHYQTTWEISGKGGVVSFTLPKEAPALEKGKNYLWQMVMIDKGEILRPDSYGVTGWIKRVDAENQQQPSLTAIERAVLYGKSGVWYDTLEVLASAQLAQPGNATLVKEWEDLLKQVGLEAVASQPITEQF